jgi:hypothetical protein
MRNALVSLKTIYSFLVSGRACTPAISIAGTSECSLTRTMLQCESIQHRIWQWIDAIELKRLPSCYVDHVHAAAGIRHPETLNTA